MTYDEISWHLANARAFLDAGDVPEADRIIRAMLGKGLTRADLDAGLTPRQLAELRAYSKRGGK